MNCGDERTRRDKPAPESPGERRSAKAIYRAEHRTAAEDRTAKGRHRQPCLTPPPLKNRIGSTPDGTGASPGCLQKCLGVAFVDEECVAIWIEKNCATTDWTLKRLHPELHIMLFEMGNRLVEINHLQGE